MAGTPPIASYASLEARRGGATSRSKSRTGRGAAVNTSQAPPESTMSGRGRGVSAPSRPTVSRDPPRRGNTHTGRTYHLSATGDGPGLATEPEPEGQRHPNPVTHTATENSAPISQAQEHPPERPEALLATTITVPHVTARDHLHPQWYIRCVMYMVAFLHTKHRVTFRAAALILLCLGFIFSSLVGNFSVAIQMPRTLKTVFSKFEINDHFAVHPICFHCHHVFEPDIEVNTFCPDCQEEVFGEPKRHNDDAADADPEDSRDPPGPRGLDFFKRPGMVSAVNSWRTRNEVDGELRCMQDARVWKELKDADEDSFFFSPKAEEEEIRLGVSFSLDWFKRSKSSFAPSQSSGVMSFCVQNLPNSLRYRSENLILSGGTGKKEPTAAQLQHYLKIIVDDLIMLYDNGIMIKTPEYPNGKLVRVALVLIIADHPAMCKLCGFADHGHDATPCTKCEVSHDEFFTEASLRNQFPKRTGEEHRRLAYMYRDLSTQEEKDEFFAEHGAQWTEFARVYYFDLVRYTVIDPMHNLLLGVAKNQWFTRWIETGALRANTPQTARELNIVHEFLESFEAPLWAGRLPLRVGEAAGGSLTADEYKFATTGPWALVIPLVWERFQKEAEDEYRAALARYPASMKEYNKRLKSWEKANQSGTKKSRRPREPKAPVRRMQPDEPRNFLCFAAALKILVGSSITLVGVDRGKKLLCDYLLGFLELYGADEMKPNHHWAVHVPDQVLDYGPVYGFWAFLTERLNKVLKNLNSNNWGGGLLEVSMMREFHRMAQLEGMLNGILGETSGDVPIGAQLEHKFIQLLFGNANDREALGTIQDAATHERASLRVVAGSIAEKSARIEDDAMRLGIVKYYNRNGAKVHLPASILRPQNTEMLGSFADILDYALLDGRRVTSTTLSKRGHGAGSSLVQIQFNHEIYAGEIRHIFRHKQPSIPKSEETVLVFIVWMIGSTETPLDDNEFLWYRFPELGAETWKYNQYAPPNDPESPPQVLPLADIQCQVARGIVRYTEPPLWITTTLDRFPTSFSAYGLGTVTGDDSDE